MQEILQQVIRQVIAAQYLVICCLDAAGPVAQAEVPQRATCRRMQIAPRHHVIFAHNGRGEHFAVAVHNLPSPDSGFCFHKARVVLAVGQRFRTDDRPVGRRYCNHPEPEQDTGQQTVDLTRELHDYPSSAGSVESRNSRPMMTKLTSSELPP